MKLTFSKQTLVALFKYHSALGVKDENKNFVESIAESH